MRQKLLCYFICSLVSIGTATAQKDTTAYKNIGLGIGLNLTRTDLSETYQKPTSSFIAYLQFAKQRKLTSALYLSFGQLTSENSAVKFLDQSEFQINSFSLTTYQSAHFEGIYNLLNKHGFKISVSQGFGFMRYSVYDQNDTLLINVLNSRAQGETYSGFSILLPTSISFSYLLKNDYGIQGRLSIQNTLTDYLDNISIFGDESNNDNIISFQITAFKRIQF
ncbi:MAG: hypothetical protein ACI9XJ_000111 [Marivirga sp.]|jgi:hypothetical protein